jgi:hypothetical protein
MVSILHTVDAYESRTEERGNSRAAAAREYSRRQVFDRKEWNQTLSERRAHPSSQA